MIYPIIETLKNQWINSPNCPVRPMIDYMRQRGQLRDTQIDAIETYLFLKIEGDNKPLANLFSEGFFFAPPQNLDNLRLSKQTRDILETDSAAWSLFQFSRMPGEDGKPLLPKLQNAIDENLIHTAYPDIIRKIFYGISYPDYLFSLPMGAGKTFLIAAFIYLDLYFAQQNPQDTRFAHNFLVLIPSGLKSSIAPSLKTIEQFDPTWVLPEPAASNIRRLLQFEMLDAPRSEKKSNRARNPNAQKVSMLINQPDPMGLVFLVNAEKVILDRLDLDSQRALIEKTDDEKSRSANELRHMLGEKIPHLAIHIDEVHHATDDEIKLRQVVTSWNKTGNVTSVLGYSGTPYLEGSDSIPVAPGVDLQFTQITNTVYYYPLVRAIQRFLKKPEIKTATDLHPREVVRLGVQEFYEKYGDKRYSDGTIAKLAIYCGKIERLEEEVYPFLRDELGITEDEILKYHRGNKDYKVPQEAALEFAALDTPASKKRIILLVQIGKEGWDCRSLTGVILAQKKDGPTNMVLQIACRCLRQVEKGALETALIWLNEDNVAVMQKQLKTEQRTSIQEINALSKTIGGKTIERFARDKYLNLPPVDFYQLRIDYGSLELEAAPSPDSRLAELAKSLDSYRTFGQTRSGTIAGNVAASLQFDTTQVVDDVSGERVRYDQWLSLIARESFGGVSCQNLAAHNEILKHIFDTITLQDGMPVFNQMYDQERIRSKIRAAFFSRRELQTNEQVIQQTASLLLASKLTPVGEKNIYPPEDDVKNILQTDSDGKSGEQLEKEYEQFRESIRQQYAKFNLSGLANMPEPIVSLAIRWKDRTLHYIPYSFAQSKLELDFLDACLQLQDFQQKRLELYYNGERGLTEFVINCYQKKGNFWKRLGEYTPDFLILERAQDSTPRRVLIVETKGAGFEESFRPRRQYVESDFLRLNKDKFGYERFEFIYIREADTPEARLAKLAAKINAFFA
jgi:type III restriction enzyme